MKNPIYLTSGGVRLSLTNLYFRNESSVIEIRDVVEDSSTAEELAANLNKLNLFEKFTVDRVTETYARLKSKDYCGNTHYFKAEF